MKIVFMGTPDFGANVLQKLVAKKYDVALVVSQPDRPVGKKKVLLPTPVKQVAMAHGISVFQPEKIKDDHQPIIDIHPDLIITAAYGQIIPKSLIDAPRLGCLNVHASLLPKYRGGAPIHQAVIDGESETGVTLMYMDVKMDTGDMIAQARTPIAMTDDVGMLFERLSELGATLLTNTLPLIEAGTNERIAQHHNQATYAYNIKREDERIDWTRDASDIYNQIRGLNPWPTAYTTIDGVNVKVFKSELMNHQPLGQEVGTITEVSSAGVMVVCGDQEVLRLLEIQISGKKRMELKELLNGDHPLRIGKVFGNE